MAEKSFQDYYDDSVSYCYGCGRLNNAGLQFKSYWDGEEAVCSYTPKSYHTAIPGFVYGGLIASIIDCHSTGTASAAAYRKAGRDMGTKPYYRYVTASLKVDFVKPAPISDTMVVKARVSTLEGRKAIINSTLSVGGVVCATGEVVAVEMPEHWISGTEPSR